MERNNKWYIIQVIPNYEQIAKENLENRVFEEGNLGIEQIFLPMSTKTLKNGSKKRKPMFPGYLFVKVDMTDNSWYTIRNTQYVTGIVGSSGQRTKPTPVPESQIENILKQIALEEQKNISSTQTSIVEPDFKVGDIVDILSGNFKEQFGKVLEIVIEKQVAIIEIEFFGRMTPVTLALSDLKKK